MIDKERIALMTKLATTDKHYTKDDLRITSHYREDYVYLNNLKTRLSILLVIAGFVALHILLKIEKGVNMPTTLNEVLSEYVFPYGTFALIILFVYTALSTHIYRKKYANAQKRRSEYLKILKKLEEHDNKKNLIEEEKDDSTRKNIIY